MTTDQDLPKHSLRAAVRRQLAALDPVWCAKASSAIVATLRSLPEFQAAEALLLYWPLQGEPDLTSLLQSKPIVAFPKVEGETLRFHVVKNASELEVGKHGVREPHDCPPFSPQPTTLCLVPGLAFDLQGTRLGRGKGFYDRFLAQAPPTLHPIGVCFDLQLQSSIPIPREPHDIPMRTILTESRLIHAE